MYDCLVLSAGGTYGAAYVGAIKALEARSAFSRIRRFHGTSAGALVATMAACGLTGAEILSVLELAANEPRPRPDLSRLGRDFGAMDIECFLKSAFDAFLPAEETFVTLAKRRGVHLSVHAYNVTRRELVDFCLDKTPDANLRQCVSASCCVPFLFSPVVIAGDRHVDGAVAQRTPMHMIVAPRDTLVLDVRDSARGDPKDVFDYIAALTSAASRWVGPYEGDFVTISVPEDTPGIADLPVTREAFDPLIAAGFDAVTCAMDARV